MLKLIIFISIFITQIVANDEKVEIFATFMDTKDNIVTADDEVVVVYKDYVLNAKRAVYNRNSADLELFGNVRANQGGDIKLLGEYAKMNIAQKERSFKPFFMMEQKSEVWLSADEGKAKDVAVDIQTGITSGCDAANPLWKIEFSSSTYNTDTMWLNLYNSKIYIGDILVFYTPYFGYSLDSTRRTGLLPPMIGFSERDGFYYEQPIYIAEQNWWDLELRPQIRTARGSGLYSTLRFVDSRTSRGFLNLGYFKENKDFFLAKNLANQEHKGFHFQYDNKNVINNWLNLNLKGQSGLYMDITDMNDVDYLNLSHNDITKTNTANQLISRTNLFYNTDDNYFGLYAKYYKDLRTENNDETLQNLPSIHYHNYLQTLFDDHLLYTINVKSNNLYRQLGKNAAQTDLNIPISLQTPLFDEYMTLKYTVNLSAQHTAFRGEDKNPIINNEFDNGVFARNYHTVSTSSQLTRAYDDFTHVLDFGTQYIFTGSEFESGYYKDQRNFCSKTINKNDPICEFYNIHEIERQLQLYFAQYFYDMTGRQVVYHRLAQNIVYDGLRNGTGELENELEYQITPALGFYNNMFYNYDENTFSKNFNQISYSNGIYTVGLSHMYKTLFVATLPKTDYVTSSISYKYDKNYSYNFRYNYDLELSRKKGIELGFLYERKCFDFGIRYVENNRPILDKSNIVNSIYDKIIYLVIRLKPFMSQKGQNSGFMFRLPGDR